MPPNPIDEVALEGRLARIEEGQKALAVRVDEGFNGLRSVLDRSLETQEKNADRIGALEKEQAGHCTALASHATTLAEQKVDTDRRVDKLAGRITTWGGGNSLAIAVGYLITFLKGGP